MTCASAICLHISYCKDDDACDECVCYCLWLLLCYIDCADATSAVS